MPTITGIIQTAIQQAEAQPAPERHLLQWDNGTISLVVVNLPLQAIFLNPNSHRIKSQLSAHPNREAIKAAPFTVASQQAIAALLKATERFEELKRNIDERGQQEPGAITQEGVLINANTRAVALRELHQTHIKVMVLPPGATSDQITELELRLQVARDLRQPYTFSNRLLFTKDCQDAAWTEARIAKEVHGTDGTEASRVGKVRRDLRMLAMIDELIGLSDGKFTYPAFDEKAVALEELDRDYEELKISDPTAALNLRGARLVAILCGVGYRDIRSIKPDFIEEYLQEEIEDDKDIKFLVTKPEDEPVAGPDTTGLDLLGDPAPGGHADAAPLLDWLTKTAGKETVIVTKVGEPPIERSRVDIVDALRTAVERAAEAAKNDNQRGDLLKQPAALIAEATKRIASAEKAYAKAHTDVNFVAEIPKLLSKLEAAKRSLDSFSAHIAKDFAPKDKTP